MRKNLLLVFPVLSLIWFASTIIIAGAHYPGYSHIAQFISELGATGSPHGRYVNYLGFIPTELLLLAFVFCALAYVPKTPRNYAGLAFVSIYALTLGISAVFPCDFQCRPDTPSLTHLIHVYASFPGYLSAIVAIFVLSSGALPGPSSKVFQYGSYFAGAVGLVAAVNLNPQTGLVGSFQRLLEFFIYGWLVFFAYHLRRSLALIEQAKRHF